MVETNNDYPEDQKQEFHKMSEARNLIFNSNTINEFVIDLYWKYNLYLYTAW